MNYATKAIPLFLLLPLARASDRSTAGTQDPPCVVAKTWVTDHPWMRPQTLEGLYYLPAIYQKAVFRSVASDQRIDYWREHLAKYSGPASRLSEDAKQFIDSVGRNLQPLFDAADPAPQITVLAELAIDRLGYRVAKVVFGKLGTEDPEILNLAMLPNRGVRPFILARFEGNSPGHEELVALFRPAYGGKVGVSSMGSCDCHTSSDFCDSITGPHEHCAPDPKCEPDGPGCGWFWLEACNGDCVWG